ncbi:MAG TPA: PD-(D/E)XK nuclease family protein [Planctomycetota bacterium]
MAATDFKCELSWSASRAREFARCKRENWYARYGSWGWWTERPAGEKVQFAILKNLSSLPAFAGTCMHEAIERWFELKRGGTAMTADELYEDARERFRAGWRQSAGQEWMRRPSKVVHLEEHQYGVDMPAERLGAVNELLQRCARYFCESRELAPVRDSLPEDWLSVEALDSYMFLGAKVYAVPDFAARVGEEIHIWDWKTGKPREADEFQLNTYALYACERWSADPEAIVLHAAYLGAGEVRSKPVDIDKLSTVQDRMSESVREMLDLHYDPDQDEVVMANWPTSGAPQACPGCRFRAVCEEGSPLT